MAFWVEPSQLVEGARMNKWNQLSLRHEAHKLASGRKGVDKENTCKESSYLYVWSWEDANSAMVFTFEPVLVNLLVNVNNISFLQRKFPVNNTSTPSELHWRRTDVVFFCPATPRYQGVHQHVDTRHVLPNAQPKCWESLCSYCDVQDLSCSLGILSKKLACEITMYSPEWMGSSSSQIWHWLLSMLDMMSSPQFLFWNSHVTSIFSKDTHDFNLS